MNFDEMDVTVVRSKGDTQKDKVKYKVLRNLRWDMHSGGVKRYTGTYDLYGNVLCTEAPNVAHTGNHVGVNGDKKCPHDIKVCILKKDNPNILYKELAKRAGEKPKEYWRDGKKVSQEVRNIVRKNPGITAVEVADILEEKEIDRRRTQNAIRYLKRKEFKNQVGLSSEKYKNTQKLTLRFPSKK